MKHALMVLMIVVAAGATWWFIQNKDEPSLPPPPREIAPQRWQVSGSAMSNTTTFVSSESINASESNNTIEGNATEDNATSPVPEDSIVTHNFVQDLSQYLVSIYHPAHTKRNPGAQPRLDLNLKRLNLRYGVDFPGLNVDPGDILQSRQIFFAHILTPAVLEFLYSTYVPLFLDDLERALQASPQVLTSGKTAQISETQRQEMFHLLATKIRAISSTVAALARTEDIQNLVSKYLADIDKVNTAHIAFWNLDPDTSSPATREEASIAIKNAIQTREMSRQRLVQGIISTANPQGLEAADLIYLAQWVYRRTQANQELLPQVAAIGDLGVKTAQALEARAKETPTNFSAPQENSTDEILGQEVQ